MNTTHIPCTIYTKLWQILTIGICLCEVSFTSALAMNDKSPIENTQNNSWDLITRHFSSQDALNAKLSSKTMKKKVEDSGERAFEIYTNNKDFQKPENQEKAGNALRKAAAMGNKNVCAKETAELYQKLMKEENEDIKLTLCTKLAKNGLFLLLDEEKHEGVFENLFLLASENKGDSIALFFDLFKDFWKMTNVGQEWFIGSILCLENRNEQASLQISRDLFKNFLKMKEQTKEAFIEHLFYAVDQNQEEFSPLFINLFQDFPHMKETIQKRLILSLYNLIHRNKKIAREVFISLESKKEFMKKSVCELYETKLGELEVWMIN